jgi:hypothetical protein
VNITLAPPGTLIGPGLGLTITLTQPVVAGDQLGLDLLDAPTNGKNLGTYVKPVSGPSHPLIVFDPSDTGWKQVSPIAQQWASASNDQAVLLQGHHTDSTGTAKDFVTLPAQWVPGQGLGLQSLLQPQATVQGGFTATDRQMLTDVQAAVTETFTGQTGAQLISKIADLIAHPDISLLHLCAGGTLSGRGQLPPPLSQGVVFVYGLSLSVAAAPPGAGLRDGAVREYSERVVQLATLAKPLGSSLQYITEILDLHADSFGWLFANKFPSNILFDVTPGFEVAYQWLCL